MASYSAHLRFRHRHWTVQHVRSQTPSSRGRIVCGISLLRLLPRHYRHFGTGSEDYTNEGFPYILGQWSWMADYRLGYVGRPGQCHVQCVG